MTKHYIFYGALIALALGIGAAWLRAHDAWKDLQADLRVKQASIKVDEQKVTAAQSTVNAATQSNTQIDAATKAKLDSLQAQLAAKPSSDQIRALIQQALPGVNAVETKDAQGNAMISVPDTQENRDAINKKDADFKSCQFSLEGCQAKQQNFLTIIAAKDQQLAAKDDVIKTQGETIGELKRFGKGGNFWSRTGRVVIPLACAGAGAYLGASKGTKGAAVGALAGGGACALSFHF